MKRIIKLLVACFILFWLWNSGKLDFSLINKALKNTQNVAITVIVLLLNSLLLTKRLSFLVQIKSTQKITFKSVFISHWIGHFFSTVLPGSISSDVIKFYYVKKTATDLNISSLTLIGIIDRVIGLAGLILIGLISFLFNFKALINQNNKFTYILTILLILFFTLSSFILSIFAGEGVKNFILKLVALMPIGRNFAEKILKEYWSFNKEGKKSYILYSFFITLVSQLLFVFSFWQLLTSLDGVSFKFIHALIFFPIMLVTTAIPITPLGLGTGNIVYQYLFEIINLKVGASLFNIQFIIMLAVNSLGVIPYLLHRNEQPAKVTS